MPTSYFPYDSGAGANVTEQQWWKMARLWRTTGIVVQGSVMDAIATGAGDFAVNPGTGLSVIVKPGTAWIEGHYFSSDSDITKTLAAADATNPRIDRIVLRNDWVANTITVEVLQGTPAATPSPPTLTQTPGTRYELPLAQVRVNANATSIASTDITDERVTSSHNSFVPAVQMTNSVNRNIAAGTTVTLTWDTDKFDPMIMHDEFGSQTDRLNIKETGLYLVYAMIFWKHPTAQNINGTCNFSIYRNRNGNIDQIARDTTYIAVTQGVQSCMKLIDCQAGDYLYVQATNNASAALDIDASTPYSPYFGAVKLGILSGY